jgi:hypothetical protein
MGESCWQVSLTETLKPAAVQQARPEDRARHRSNLRPLKSRSQACADNASGAGARDNRWPNAKLGERFDDADVRQSAH